METLRINSDIMGSEKESKLLFKFAVPAMIGMVAGSMYNIIDRIFIGHVVGPSALGSIAIAFPSMLLIIALTAMIGIGGGARISILWGSDDLEQAQQTLGNAIFLLLLAGIFFTAFSFFGLDFVLSLSSPLPGLIEGAKVFLKIIMSFAPIGILAFGLNFFIKASGAPSYAMFTQILGAVCNIIFSALFVMLFKWGIAGAAYATVLAQTISAAWAISYFLRPSCPIKIKPIFLFRPKIKVISKILALGIPACFIELSIVCFMTLANRIIQQNGGELAVSVMGIFLSLDSLLFLPAIAIGDASQTIIGYNFGAGKYNRILSTIKSTLLWTTVFYSSVFIIAQLFAPYLIGMFSNDPKLIEMGTNGVRIGYLCSFVMGIPIVTSSALLGMAKSVDNFILSITRNVIILIVPLFVLPPIFGLNGVWMVFPVADFVGTLVASIFLYRIINHIKKKIAVCN